MNIPARYWAIAFAAALVLWFTLFWALSAIAQPRSYQHATRVVVQFETPENVASLCAMLGVENAVACANEQVIIMPNPCLYAGRYPGILCHELGHVNGWGADHP